MISRKFLAGLVAGAALTGSPMVVSSITATTPPPSPVRSVPRPTGSPSYRPQPFPVRTLPTTNPSYRPMPKPIRTPPETPWNWPVETPDSICNNE